MVQTPRERQSGRVTAGDNTSREDTSREDMLARAVELQEQIEDATLELGVIIRALAGMPERAKSTESELPAERQVASPPAPTSGPLP